MSGSSEGLRRGSGGGYALQTNLVSLLNDPDPAARAEQKAVYARRFGPEFQDRQATPDPKARVVSAKDFRAYIESITEPLKTSREMRERSRTAEAGKRLDNVAIDRSLSSEHDGGGDQAVRYLCVKGVPSMFFRQDFSLADSNTFNDVLAGGQPAAELPQSAYHLLPGVGGDRYNSTSSEQVSQYLLLREKLASHLDLVEMHLAKQISKQSTAFFSAMRGQTELYGQVRETLIEIGTIRQQLKHLDKHAVTGPLKVVSLHRQRVNMRAYLAKLERIVAVRDAYAQIQILVSANDYTSAMDLMSEVKLVMNTELAGIVCLRPLQAQLLETEMRIEDAMAGDFCTVATELGLNNESFTDEMLAEKTKERLEPLVLGLLRKRCFRFLEPFREETQQLVKDVIRDTVMRQVHAADSVDDLADEGVDVPLTASTPLQAVTDLSNGVEANTARSATPVTQPLASVTSTAGGKSPSLASQMRNLPFLEWVNMMSKVYVAVSKLLKAIHASLECVKQTCAQSIPALLMETELRQIEIEAVDIFDAATELAHVRCAKLLAARGPQLERMSISEYEELSRASDDFLTSTLQLCQRKAQGLRATLSSQGKRYLEAFYSRHVTSLNAHLDSESWQKCDVPADFQMLVLNYEDGTKSILDESVALENKTQTAPVSEFLVVNRVQFRVAGCVLVILKTASAHISLAAISPHLVTDIVQKMVHIFKSFNKRTCDLILGTQALKTAGLKTITAKHLALASQCIGAVGRFIPLLRARFGTLMPAKQHVLLSSFDVVQRDYDEHKEQIYLKILSIMNDVFAKNVANDRIRKDELIAGNPASNYMISLVKEATKLYKALFEVLSAEEIQVIFHRVCVKYNALLIDAYAELDFALPSQRQRITSDVKYYTESLSSLEGLLGPGKEVETYVRERCSRVSH